MMQEHEKAKVLQALGGKKGIIDSSVPALLFVFTQSIAHNLQISLIVALSMAAVLTTIRLINRDSLVHSFSGLFGVMICAAFAYFTNSPKGYFAPSIGKNAFFLSLYAFGNIIRWPVIGVVLGAILGEDTRWRKDKLRLRAYTMASWVWFLMFAIRFGVQYSLFHKDYLTALGIANIFLGLPLYLLTLWATWEIIKRVPTTSATESNQDN
jgi:hypothetical protein